MQAKDAIEMLGQKKEMARVRVTAGYIHISGLYSRSSCRPFYLRRYLDKRNRPS